MMQKKGCPEFQSFLDEAIGSREQIKRLQEFMGYCLVNRVWFQNYLVLFGNSESKAIFLDIMTRLVGWERCSFEPLSHDHDELAARLRTSALNITRIGDADLKSCSPVLHPMVGGDVQHGIVENGATIVFVPTCKFIFSHPGWNVADISMTYSIRARILPVTFRNKPQVLEDPADEAFWNGDGKKPFLIYDMFSEISGIRSWAIQGWWRLFERGGFRRPACLSDDIQHCTSVTIST